MQPNPALQVQDFCTISCPAQVLVIDHLNGPASILVDTISLLLDREISVTSVDKHFDALRALDICYFDLVVVGADETRPAQLSLLPHIRVQHPALPVMVVGQNLPPTYQQYARRYGAYEVVNLPERATGLKAMAGRLAHYLEPAAV